MFSFIFLTYFSSFAKYDIFDLGVFILEGTLELNRILLISYSLSVTYPDISSISGNLGQITLFSSARTYLDEKLKGFLV